MGRYYWRFPPALASKPVTDSDNQQPYAGLLRRLGALLYDSLLLLALLFLATALALAVTRGELHGSDLWFRLYLLLVMFVFFGWFWTHGGQTLGMRAWKIRLERPDGSAVGWGQAAVRFLTGLVTLGLGHLWLLFDPQHRSLYDLITNTRMVRVQAKYVPPAD
jgi:uncharacterized RDD family membrane protein YckC